MSRFFAVLFILSLTLGSCLDGELYTPGNEFAPEEKDYPAVFTFKTDGVTVNYSKNEPFATVSDSTVIASTLVVDQRGEDGSGDYFIINYPDQKWTEGIFTEIDGVRISYTIGGQLHHNLDISGAPLPINVAITGIEEVIIAKDTLNVMHGSFSANLQTEDGLKEIIMTEGVFRNIPVL